MEMESATLLVLSLLLFPATATAISLLEKALPTSSGYFPINASSGSSIFYAFYEAQQSASSLTQMPLLVWLQGGPGCSSLLGNFFELGPRLVTPSPSNHSVPILTPNPGAWNRRFELIFIDNPIGAGFSFAASPEEIPRDESTVASHLYIALRLFLASSPSFKSRPLYITGESYAGKYVPAIGYHILHQNSRLPASHQVNLQGVAIGNGLTDPITQVATHAATAFFFGLINEKQRVYLEKLQSEAVSLVQEEKWLEARNARNKVLLWLQNATGLPPLYSLRRQQPYETELIDALLQSEEVKKALGAKEGLVWETCSAVVKSALHGDVMKSVKFMVEELVKKSRVLLYQGQFDVRDGVVSNEAWIKKMEWEGLKNFYAAERKVWKVNGMVSGYVQTWGSLTHAVVSGAGHMAPADQSLSSQAMIEDWVMQRGDFADAVSNIRESP